MKCAVVLSIVFGFLCGKNFAQFSFQMDGGLDAIFETPQAQAVFCLIPDEFTDFIFNLTIRDIYNVIKISPQLESLSTNASALSYEQIETIFEDQAPELYAKLENFVAQYQTQFNNMTQNAKNFLLNIAQQLDQMKNYDNVEEDRFDMVHEFFQNLYQNYTKLDNASRSSIVNFFPSLAHIIGSQTFTNFLQSCANATNSKQLDQVGKIFLGYVIEHGCDGVSQTNDSTELISRAKRYINYFKK